VFQNVAYGLRLRRVRGPALVARVEEGLRKVNLSGLGRATRASSPAGSSSGSRWRGRWC